MTRIYLLLLLIFVAVSSPARVRLHAGEKSSADYYRTHWSRVDAALADDLPATALGELSLLRQRALLEDNMPQLCRALFQAFQCSVSISPDSLQPSVEAIRHAMQQESGPVQRAIYAHLLGRLQGDEALLRSSLADLPMLADARAADFLPLLDLGEDSRWVYGDDLLSVFLLGFPPYLDSRAYVREAIRLYEQRGRKAAALLLAQRLCDGAAELYPLWRAAVDSDATLLRVTPIAQYLAQEEHPSLSLQCLNEQGVYPGGRVQFALSARNLREATLTVAGQSLQAHFPDSPVWEERYDTISVIIPKAGVYEAVLSAGGHSSKLSLHVSSLRVLTFGLPDGRCRVSVVDAASGRPVGGARLAKRDKSGRTLHTYLPQADGNLYLTRADYEWRSGEEARFYPSTSADTFHPALSPWYFSAGYYGDREAINETHVSVYTDRAVYRPAQDVQLGLISYVRHEDEYQVHPHDTLSLTLFDANRQEIGHERVITDTFGVASVTWSLPPTCPPGYCSLTVRRGRDAEVGWHSFVVEEYKRPTFSVKVKVPEIPVQRGDTVCVEGEVKTYTGIPLAGVRVSTSEGDTLYTDARGCFSHRVVVTQGRWYRSWHTVTYDVTSLHGESATGTAHIPLRWAVAQTEEKTDRHQLPFWSEERHTSGGSEATLTVGTCLGECYAVIDVVAGRDVVAHKEVAFSDSMCYTLRYRPEWGDGAQCYVAFMREGQLHYAHTSVQRPAPDKRLLLHWESFRPALQPGQTEEWTLRATYPDGRPAGVSLMACLYDASLEAFAHLDWNIPTPFQRNLPYSQWESGQMPTLNMYVSPRMPSFKPLNFTQWRTDMLHGYVRMDKFNSPVTGMKLAARQYNAAPMMKGAAVADAAVAESVSVRTEMGETAFFMPSLHSDTTGRATLRFRLPESLTTWRFIAMAHDAWLNHGVLIDTVVARKLLMAEINAPRFRRVGDVTQVPVTLTNLSESPQACVLRFSVNGKEQCAQLQLMPGERRVMMYSLDASCDSEAEVVLRAVLASAEYSDGEERRVPVLPASTEMVRAVPYSMSSAGERTLNLSPLWEDICTPDGGFKPGVRNVRLSHEQTTQPVWHVVQSLLPLLKANSASSSSWAQRLYAIDIAAHLRPWLTSVTMADSASQQDLALLSDSLALAQTRLQAIRELRSGQSAEGGWPWYRGMPSSVWITTEISTLLARVRLLTGQLEPEAETLLSKALKYLHAEMAKEVQTMRQTERHTHSDVALSDAQYQYLYLCAITRQASTASIRYLLKHAQHDDHRLSMLGKAGSSVIMTYYGREKAARRHLRSLLEYTVVTEEMGRYFDTPRAQSSWRNYRIPSQTFAIEALQRGDSARYARELAEMRLWLMQSRRTQKWQCMPTVCDAVYAVLTGLPQEHASAPDAGYAVQSLPVDSAMRSLTLRNDREGLMWGAVVAHYECPTDMVQGAHSGIVMERSMEVKRGDRWTPADTLRIGDKVRLSYTLTLDRDMDYVRLQSQRAACLEPVQPLSGYDLRGGMYRSVHDQSQDCAFEHLGKGVHRFSEEFFVDRAGRYAMGVATAECVYAPEFRANAPSLYVIVKP